MTDPRSYNFYEPLTGAELAAFEAWLAQVKAEGWTARSDATHTLHQVTMRRPLPLPLSPGELGLDVSHWQGTIDWVKARAAGYRFVYIKRSQGVDLVDSRGLINWKGAHNAGFLIGGYHYFEHDKDGGQQAMHFSATLGEDVGHLTPAVDVEPDGQPRLPLHPKAEITDNLKKFLDTLENLGLRPCVIYTSAGAWPTMTTLPAWAGEYPLWAADWTDPLQLPAGWSHARYRQKGQRAVNGFASDVDWNVFQGAEAIPQPVPGFPYQALTKTALNLRDAAGNIIPNAAVPAGVPVTVHSIISRIGPNALGQFFDDRAVLATDGRNVWNDNLDKI